MVNVTANEGVSEGVNEEVKKILPEKEPVF